MQKLSLLDAMQDVLPVDDEDDDDQMYAKRLMSRLRLSSEEAERACDLVARRTDRNRQEEERLHAVRQEAHEALLTPRKRIDHQFYQALLDKHMGDVIHDDSVASTGDDARTAMKYWISCGLDPKILDEDWVPPNDDRRWRSESHSFQEQAPTQADVTQGTCQPTSAGSLPGIALSSKARGPPQEASKRHPHHQPLPTTPALLPPAIITPTNTTHKEPKSQPHLHTQQHLSKQPHQTPAPPLISRRSHQTITPPETTSTTPQQLISPPKSSHAHPPTTRYTPRSSLSSYTTTTPSISTSTSASASTPHFPTLPQPQSLAQSRTYSHPWFSLDPTAFSHSHARSHPTPTFPPAHVPINNVRGNGSANTNANANTGPRALAAAAAALTPEATPTRERSGGDTNASASATAKEKEKGERIEVRIKEMRTPVGEGTPSRRKVEKGMLEGKGVEKKRGVGRPRKRLRE